MLIKIKNTINNLKNWFRTQLSKLNEDINLTFSLDIGEIESDKNSTTESNPLSAVNVSVNMVASGPPKDMVQIIYEIASHWNSGETKVYYPVRNDSSGTLDAYIGHNDSATNMLVAQTIVNAAQDNNLDPLYLSSVIQQESIFSPVTFNHNLSQSNLTPNFKTTDWGICQYSGNFLPNKPGMEGLTEDEMQAKAFDPTWAIPVMAEVYAGLISEAKKSLSTDSVLASAVHTLNTTLFTDAQWLGALSYNRGASGAIADVKNNSTALIKHPYRCGQWYSYAIDYASTGKFP